ncbi:MAG TPA: FxsA family protein [Nitrospirae bacterium]|nr:phage T7 F exclusion suppressor FxsA [bacterium BMS3Abin10]GBE38247.1 phage T7 F exclusion suppressor FxsA [bacterium BMS3Bbin08]HDH50541.1 FxsA family protein [Nitrospirota bacterium]HDK17693.1 FxsA family protein [Nitrospirota bacterium]HDO26272.1 FxsA family protein [Nitrospirota bacterium]
MFFKLFLLFVIIPVIELSLLIKVGSIIGTLNTIVIIMLTAVIGAYMVRMEGLGILYRIQQNMHEGIFPAEELINGLMILIAGALLLTPGFLTDITGFLIVFPASRNIIKKIAKRYIRKSISSMDVQINKF